MVDELEDEVELVGTSDDESLRSGPRAALVTALEELDELEESGDALLVHVPEHALLKMELRARRLGLRARDAIRGKRRRRLSELTRIIEEFEQARAEGVYTVPSSKAAMAAKALGGTRIQYSPPRAAIEGEIRQAVAAATAWS